MNRLIVCGPDKCGKSTLVSMIENVLGIKKYKSKVEKSLFSIPDAQFNMLRYAIPEVMSIIDLFRLEIVFDRFIPCEYVYSTVFKRNTDVDLIFKLDQRWNEMNGKIIFVWNDEPFEKDDIIDVNYHKQIVDTYHEYLEKTSCKYLNLKNDSTIENAFKQIVGFVKNEN